MKKINKLKKLILDGPKYLVPLIEGIVNKSFSIFFNEPEKRRTIFISPRCSSVIVPNSFSKTIFILLL